MAGINVMLSASDFDDYLLDVAGSRRETGLPFPQNSAPTISEEQWQAMLNDPVANDTENRFLPEAPAGQCMLQGGWGCSRQVPVDELIGDLCPQHAHELAVLADQADTDPAAADRLVDEIDRLQALRAHPAKGIYR